MEQDIKAVAKLKKEFELLITINGIGNILALTIMFEVGDKVNVILSTFQILVQAG